MEAAATAAGRLSAFEQLRYARQIIQAESRTLSEVAKRLDGQFCRAVGYLYQCQGMSLSRELGRLG